MTIKQSIPDVGFDIDSHTRVLRSIKEAVELGQRATPNMMESFLTVADLNDLNIVGVEGKTLRGPQIRRIFPTPLNNWDYSTSIPPFSVVKEMSGRVFFEGALNFVNFGGVASVVVLNLPAGHRPAFDVVTQYINGGIARLCTISADGNVTVTVDPLTFLVTGHFNGINFLGF